ncbi:MAG: FAD-dependent oxidoreductase [Bacteroidota bacterium]
MKQFLIVGGGLAGLCLAEHLVNAGQKVTICDKGNNKSSTIAAGLINPMVFRRMTKSWRLDEFIHYAKPFYQELAPKKKILNPIIIRRFFAHEEEVHDWKKREELEDFQNYLYPLTDEDMRYAHPKTNNSFGTGRVKNAYWIDVKLFISELTQVLKGKGVQFYQEEVLEREIIADDFVFYGQRYDGIIFCAGYESVFSSLFPQKMINPTKGQVLTVHSIEIPNDESINRKCFVLPMQEGNFKIGSTYEWQNTDDTITEAGKSEILTMLSSLGDFDLELIDQKAGIRPATYDRRPILGQHPDFEGIYIFNGLGTKGYLMAPLLAKEMTAFILNGEAVHPETSLLRFMK